MKLPEPVSEIRPWEWDGNPCDYDSENEAPWLTYQDGRPILSGEIHCDSEANARLIAAAPDLLEFAQEVRRSGDTRLASMAIAVISKAEGGAA